MDREIRARLKWIRMYHEIGNIGIVSRRCGVSRPTLQKWIKRYEGSGFEGLKSRSRRPNRFPSRKVHEEQEQWILSLRKTRKIGARRIQNELRRLHDCSLSLDTIHRVLKRNKVTLLPRRKKRTGTKRYQRPIPGERVQMDTCKIAPGLYQYTAVDDCTRYRVLGIYPRRTAANTLLFIEKVMEEMPFPIQRIQTDRGREFFAMGVQKKLMDLCIKFRPIRPGSPHLNGKVERSQRTDLDEFYATLGLPCEPCEELENCLQEWQHFYNWHRQHGSLAGLTPMDRFFELIHKTPFWSDVEINYDRTKERIQEANYRIDQELRRWK